MVTRYITSIILLSLVTVAIYAYGAFGLAILVSVGFLLAGHEFLRMGEYSGYRTIWPLGLVLMAGLMVDAVWPQLGLQGLIILLLVLIPALLGLLRPPGPNYLLSWGLFTLSVLYVGGMGGYLFRIAKLEDGLALLVLALGATWTCDATAFFIGKRWGRTPFFQFISPKKTWEGAAAGVVGGMLGVSLVGWLYGFTIPFVLIFGFVVTVGSTLGDLAESLIKRQLQLKDSGALLAGHGGLFDRLDSAFWAVVFAYYCTILLLPVLK